MVPYAMFGGLMWGLDGFKVFGGFNLVKKVVFTAYWFISNVLVGSESVLFPS